MKVNVAKHEHMHRFGPQERGALLLLVCGGLVWASVRPKHAERTAQARVETP